ncbi:hypothetical protein GCK72_008249 [Caenorhabditis remanei]|uniref:Ribosome biogenesis protein BRX1 homolog n=1 Tax=Caenorhabditis remanei TaxID=31234 RepID=A0A6A5H026_CAERE|nr:hypothetical protein GCK72_008249 [Caenorhabditis remanei]KAF1760003.1 hypothetical protein GCK72_008249 [Caenorhabditis remanei]
MSICQRAELWTNRERVLVLCSRGADVRTRYLMKDIKDLLPHAKGDSKLDQQKSLKALNEIAEMKNCTKVMYFESRKRKDTYLWMSNVEKGPSIKFLVHNVHTMKELKMSGNCLKASRPVLSFDDAFEQKPHLKLIKEVLMQTLGTPHHHPRSQPFVDHVFNFSVGEGDKIWFRNFQIVDESLQLQEVGPRFVLEMVRLFAGSFEGAVLYDNPNYVSPNVIRREHRKGQHAYIEKQLALKASNIKQAKVTEILAEKTVDLIGKLSAVHISYKFAPPQTRATELFNIFDLLSVFFKLAMYASYNRALPKPEKIVWELERFREKETFSKEFDTQDNAIADSTEAAAQIAAQIEKRRVRKKKSQSAKYTGSD